MDYQEHSSRLNHFHIFGALTNDYCVCKMLYTCFELQQLQGLEGREADIQLVIK